MKIISRLVLAAAITALLCVGVRAGDYATLNFIGFSKDGRYLAFEEFGVQDGSGFPYSNYYFIDVLKNSYAASPVTVRIDRDTATEALARSRAKLGAGAALRRLKIVAGNQGSHVVARLLTDVGVNHFFSDKPEGPQTINFAELIGSMYRSGDFNLVLKSPEAKSTKGCEYAKDDYTVVMLDLSLVDRGNDRTVTLQKDASLPSARGCPISYAMQHVYLYEDKIAVFINTYYRGFEGPDMRYMVVTGKFK